MLYTLCYLICVVLIWEICIVSEFSCYFYRWCANVEPTEFCTGWVRLKLVVHLDWIFTRQWLTVHSGWKCRKSLRCVRRRKNRCHENRFQENSSSVGEELYFGKILDVLLLQVRFRTIIVSVPINVVNWPYLSNLVITTLSFANYPVTINMKRVEPNSAS